MPPPKVPPVHNLYLHAKKKPLLTRRRRVMIPLSEGDQFTSNPTETFKQSLTVLRVGIAAETKDHLRTPKWRGGQFNQGHETVAVVSKA